MKSLKLTTIGTAMLAAILFSTSCSKEEQLQPSTSLEIESTENLSSSEITSQNSSSTRGGGKSSCSNDLQFTLNACAGFTGGFGELNNTPDGVVTRTALFTILNHCNTQSFNKPIPAFMASNESIIVTVSHNDFCSHNSHYNNLISVILSEVPSDFNRSGSRDLPGASSNYRKYVTSYEFISYSNSTLTVKINYKKFKHFSAPTRK